MLEQVRPGYNIVEQLLTGQSVMTTAPKRHEIVRQRIAPWFFQSTGPVEYRNDAQYQ